MKRMKTFLIYLLLVLAVVLSTDILAKLILETNYKPLNKYEIAVTSPTIEITESKVSRVDGKVKGVVTNKTESFMENVFLKLEAKSKTNNTLGTEYVKMGNFQPGQHKDFAITYKYADVDSFVIDVTDHAEAVPSIEDEPVYKEVNKYLPIIKLVAWCVTPTVYFLPLFLFTGK